MGNNTSSMIPPPLSLNDCIVNVYLDPIMYYTYNRRGRIKLQQRTALDEIVKVKRKWYDDMSLLNKLSNGNKRSKRKVKKHSLQIRAPDGNLRAILPTAIVWFKLYVKQPIMSKHMQR